MRAEWKPLLASSIIFYGQLRSRVSRLSVLVFSPVLVLKATFFLGLFFHSALFNQVLPILIIAALIIATVIISAYTSLLLSRKFMLKADRKAADLTGQKSFLDVLRKIQSLERSDSQQDKMSAWVWIESGDAPSVEKIIEKSLSLESFSTLLGMSQHSSQLLPETAGRCLN